MAHERFRIERTWLSAGLQLAGDIEKAHECLRKMVLDLENLDATILQFDPDFRVESRAPQSL